MSKRRRPLAFFVLIVIAALISACGSSVPAATGTGGIGGGNNTAANLQKAMKFAACMRSNGVSEFPDPSTSGDFTIDAIANGSSLDTNAPAFTQAVSACKNLEPSGFVGHKRGTQEQEAALKFAQCMRANGVPDFPDPTPTGPLIDTTRIPSAAGRGARSIPGVRAAAHKCTATYSGELGLRGQ